LRHRWKCSALNGTRFFTGPSQRSQSMFCAVD
jgi:hypothetical protein